MELSGILTVQTVRVFSCPSNTQRHNSPIVPLLLSYFIALRANIPSMTFPRQAHVTTASFPSPLP